MNFPIRELSRKAFPPLLFEIPEPPEKLFIRGELWDREAKLLAVVGSRAHTPYGKQAVEKLIGGLCGENIVIVSGLALGIDTLAHRAALDTGLQTIAIPGSGLSNEVIYPSSNRKFAQEILEKGGCLLSEFEPHEKSQVYMFPKRNRIMAALSDAVLIVEAEEKSGTLITARLATEYGKDVLTVPGSIFSKSTEGPHMLMKLGATPIRTSDDILEALHIAKLQGENVSEKMKEKKYNDLSPEEKKVINVLKHPMTKDDLISSLDLPTSDIQGILMMLEIKGIIKEEYGEIRLV